MLESTFAVVSGLATGVVLTLLSLKPWVSFGREPDHLTFEEIARAAAAAKLERRDELPDHDRRQFDEGVDAVLAECLERDMDSGPEDLELAYRAGGEEVELEP